MANISDHKKFVVTPRNIHIDLVQSQILLRSLAGLVLFVFTSRGLILELISSSFVIFHQEVPNSGFFGVILELSIFVLSLLSAVAVQ
jgi:hypothetical protein